VSDDDAHRGNSDYRSVRALAVKLRTFGLPQSGVGAWPLGAAEQIEWLWCPFVFSLRCDGDHRTFSCDNVRQVECWLLTYAQAIADTGPTWLSRASSAIVRGSSSLGASWPDLSCPGSLATAGRPPAAFHVSPRLAVASGHKIDRLGAQLLRSVRAPLDRLLSV